MERRRSLEAYEFHSPLCSVLLVDVMVDSDACLNIAIPL